ncbi:MAG: spore germination protein [Halanaerobiaceae bacterium]
MKKRIDPDLEKNISYIEQELGADTSFDVQTRKFTVGKKQAALIFLDGFIKDELIFSLEFLMETKRKEISVNSLKKIINKRLPYFEVSTVKYLDEVVTEALSGPQVFLIAGCKEAIIIDGRSWESRSISEPELEKATRGPADGFVETLLFNVVAVRRRIKDKNFRAEVLEIGRRSKNDVALLYLDDVINKNLLAEVRDKLESVDVDGLPLADRSIEDIITGGSLNPLPRIRYTERPDNLAAHILEGHLAIVVDNSPTALILPAPFLSHVQTLESYRKGPLVGTYFSFLRFLAIFVSVLLPVIWLIFSTNRELLPEMLRFIGPREKTNIGLGLQFILATLGIDLIRMASILTPDTLATSLSLIGALILGEFAVEVGLFTPEVILYMAVAAIGSFAVPGYELSMVLKLIRLILLVSVMIGNLYGFIITFLLILLWIGFTKSFGVYYLWPLIPFDYQALKSLLVNQTVMDLSRGRPDALDTKDDDRSPQSE